MRYRCSNCNRFVKPINKKNNFLFFTRYQLICPICKQPTLTKIETRIPKSQSEFTHTRTPLIHRIPTERVVKVPSVSDFLENFRKGEDFRKVGDFNEAKRTYLTAIGLNHQNITREHIVEALDRFEIEHLGDNSHEWSIPMAKIKEALLKPSQKERIQKEKNRIVDTESRREAEAILVEAERLESAGELERAREKCNNAIQMAPSFTRAYKKRAWICLLLPDYEKYLNQVIQDCSTVLELEPDDIFAYNDRGRAYSRKGDLEKARLDYRNAIERNPSYTVAALNTMAVEILLGRYKDVISTFGLWRRDVARPSEMLIASYLVCVALTLDGKTCEAYKAPLLDQRIKIKRIYGSMVKIGDIYWNNNDLYKHLDNLERKSPFHDRVAKAKKIKDLFEMHCEE